MKRTKVIFLACLTVLAFREVSAGMNIRRP
jgi:hypothetical protein